MTVAYRSYGQPSCGCELYSRASAGYQDPEGILAAPKGGHIQRRSLEKQMAQDKALALEVEREKERAHAELVAQRAVSIPMHLHLVLSGNEPILSLPAGLHCLKASYGINVVQLPC